MKILAIPYKKAARAITVAIPRFAHAPHPSEDFFSSLPPRVKKDVDALKKKHEFLGNNDEAKILRYERKAPEHVVLLGLGEKERWNERKLPLISRRCIRHALREKFKEMAISPVVLPPAHEIQIAARIFTENAILAEYEYNAYREAPKGGWPKIATLYLAVGEKEISETQRGIREGIISGEEINACRTLANTPGGEMTPRHLAEAARETARRTGMKISVLARRELEKLGMGGVLGVSRGSAAEPCFIILEYAAGPKNQPPLALIGKGVTFDTGGLNLKPSDYIYEMHMDMSGGAAVIHGMAAIARLKLQINVVGLIPAVENMPSGSSYRPGDLLKTYSGKTIEALNTDAEGRIILADALSYAKKFSPGLIVDFATLTGAASVALGKHASALFTNRSELVSSLIDVGTTSGDYVWPLPLWDEYLENIKGTFGDLANVGKKGSGGDAINGAKFLEQFVPAPTPWAHIDIAPRMTSNEYEYLAKGAAGAGVRYIVELAKRYPEIINPKF